MANGISGWGDEERWARASRSEGASPSPAAGRASGASSPRESVSSDGAPRLPDTPLPHRFEELVATRGVSEVRRDARDVEMQRKLETFRAAMVPVYRTPDGDFPAATAFRMSTPCPVQARSLAQPKTVMELRAAAGRAHLSPGALNRIESGRASPEEIRAMTQALIDESPRPARGWTTAAIRQVAFDHGVGIDCAGYAQQAYLRASGATRASAGFGPVERESLSSLRAHGWSRVRGVADVRPGDIVVLGPPSSDQPGHRAIVYDQRVATAADVRDLLALDDPDPQHPRAHQFATGGPIRVFEVDSSWGSGGHPQVGGVRRDTWWLNESTGRWAYVVHGWDQATGTEQAVFAVASLPYGHPLEGFFRQTQAVAADRVAGGLR